MANRVYNKTGTKANLPALNRGEIAYTTDTRELFIGSSGNKRIIQVKVGTIAIGYCAHLTTPTSNGIAIGSYSLNSQTTATGNLAIGGSALRYNTTGSKDTFCQGDNPKKFTREIVNFL
jgi:hypothetical protein